MYSQAEPDAARTDIYGLLRLTEENNPSAVDAVSRQARALGRGLSLVVAALAPELVLITGEITSVWERFSPLIEEELSKSMLAGTPPRIETAGDGEFARLRGAAAVLLQRHVRYHRSTHAHSSRAERRVSQ
jgi:predicted NBD/HSP70 family sugar kinase